MSHITLRDIFADKYDAYCKRFGTTKLNKKIADAICTCRTEALGGHLYQCPQCSDTVPLHPYNGLMCFDYSYGLKSVISIYKAVKRALRVPLQYSGEIFF